MMQIGPDEKIITEGEKEHDPNRGSILEEPDARERQYREHGKLGGLDHLFSVHPAPNPVSPIRALCFR
jgi:hypothetical protein